MLVTTLSIKSQDLANVYTEATRDYISIHLCKADVFTKATRDIHQFISVRHVLLPTEVPTRFSIEGNLQWT